MNLPVFLAATMLSVLQSSTAGSDQSAGPRTRRVRQSDYDQCSHPFHSFLCQPAPRPRTFQPAGVRTVINPPVLQPAPSFQAPVVANPATPRTTAATPTLVADGSFHRESKLPPAPYLPPEDPVFDGAAAAQPPQVFAKRDPDSPPQDDNCRHAFHSFLCNSGAKSQRKTPTGAAPSFKPQQTNVLNSEGTFLQPSKVKPPVQPAATTTAHNCQHTIQPCPCLTSTTLKPSRDNIITGDSTFLHPAKIPLPSPPPTRTTYRAVTAPQTTAKPFIYRPTTTTTTSRPVVTTKRPPAVNPPLTGAAQTPNIAVVQPDHGHDHDHHHHHHHHGADFDICKDPFHSFLCVKVDPTKRRFYDGQRFKPSGNAPKLRGDSSFLQSTKVLPPSTTTYRTIPTTPYVFQTRKPATQYPTTTTPVTTRPPPTPAPFIANLRSDSTFVQPSRVLPPPQTTLNPPCDHTTPRTQDIEPQAAHNPKQVAFNPTRNKLCEHPFHTSLCDPPKPPRKLVPGPLKGDSSFVNPSQVSPPRTTTPTSPNLNGEAAQDSPVAVLSKDDADDNCKHAFHSFLCDPVPNSRRRRPDGRLPSHRGSNLLTGDSTFLQPAKVLPPNIETSESRDSQSGYSYPRPDQEFITPKPSNQVTDKQPGYNYPKPSQPFITPSPKLIPQPSNQVQGYSYPVPPEDQQFTTPTSTNQVTSKQPGYNYPKPSQPFVTPSPKLSPQPSNQKQGYSYAKPPPEQQLTTHKPISEPNNQDPNVQPGYNYPKPASNKAFVTPKPINQVPNNQERRYDFPSPGYGFQNPSSNPPIPSPAENPAPFDVLRIGDASTRNLVYKKFPEPPEVRSSRQAPAQSVPLLSPAEFVRGPPGIPSVLGSANIIPHRCNHPFHGYICKRSSDRSKRQQGN